MNNKRTRSQQATGESEAPYTILITEDDEGLARLIEKKLQRAGLPTARASNGAECIAWVAAHRNVLLLLDYCLPDMMANQIVESLAEQNGKVPFVIITGHGNEKIAVEMMKLGARDYLIKEEGFLDLLPSVVERVLGELITDKELAEAQQALRESEEKYRNLVERANDGIAIIQDRVLKYVNQRFAQIGGYTIEELVGVPFTDFVHPDDRAEVVDRYNRRMAGKDVSLVYELAIAAKNGAKLYLEVNAGLITYMGEPANLVIVRDITDRKRAEESAQERLEELEKWEKLTVGRELKMIELKREIEDLQKQLAEVRERLAP